MKKKQYFGYELLTWFPLYFIQFVIECCYQLNWCSYCFTVMCISFWKSYYRCLNHFESISFNSIEDWNLNMIKCAKSSQTGSMFFFVVVVQYAMVCCVVKSIIFYSLECEKFYFLLFDLVLLLLHRHSSHLLNIHCKIFVETSTFNRA